MNIGDKVICVKDKFTLAEWGTCSEIAAKFKIGDKLIITRTDFNHPHLITFSNIGWYPKCGFELYTEQHIKPIKDLKELVKKLKELDIK